MRPDEIRVGMRVWRFAEPTVQCGAVVSTHEDPFYVSVAIDGGGKGYATIPDYLHATPAACADSMEQCAADLLAAARRLREEAGEWLP